ncbi:GDP-L-fucose synthase [Porticoccaceae bacterium]|nr:GDP-L-fucose synthase [Porticoccaceae bacterium]
MKKLFSHEKKRIYVAGHRGLAGSAIVRRLSNFDCELLTAGHEDLDLTNQADVNTWFSNNAPDVVYLAAATAGGIHANYERPGEFIFNNLAIQNNVIDAAYRCGVEKLCFLGSSCIYPRLAPQPMREESLLTGPLDKHNVWYAVAKIAGLMLVDGYSKQYGCDFISVMPANLYGPGDKYTEENSHVVAALIKKFHEGKITKDASVEIWGTGAAMREFLHCDDMADACVHLMESYSSPEIINIGTGVDVSISDLAYLIKDVVGYDGEVVFNPNKPDGMPKKVVDTSALEKAGWSSKISLAEGLASTYKSFLEIK